MRDVFPAVGAFFISAAASYMGYSAWKTGPSIQGMCLLVISIVLGISAVSIFKLVDENVE